jgi:hypothetical protein
MEILDPYSNFFDIPLARMLSENLKKVKNMAPSSALQG